MVKCEGVKPGEWEHRCPCFLWLQHLMAKIRTLYHCNCTTHLVALSRNHMAVSSLEWSSQTRREEAFLCLVMCRPLSRLFCLPSPLEIPSFPWCLGLCGLRLLTSQTTRHSATCKSCWKSQPDHLVLTNEVPLNECQLEFRLLWGPPLHVSSPRASW